MKLMTRELKYIYLMLFCLIGITTFLLFTNSREKMSIVVIDNLKVFESFQMKKDYDIKIEKELSREKVLLDSISTLLKNSPIEDLKLKKEYKIVSDNLNSKFELLSRQYTNEVYLRLNDYLKLFGEKNNLDIIVGSTGQGNIVFTNQHSDLTDEAIKFINNKYLN